LDFLNLILVISPLVYFPLWLYLLFF